MLAVDGSDFPFLAIRQIRADSCPADVPPMPCFTAWQASSGTIPVIAWLVSADDQGDAESVVSNGRLDAKVLLFPRHRDDGRDKRPVVCHMKEAACLSHVS